MECVGARPRRSNGFTSYNPGDPMIPTPAHLTRTFADVDQGAIAAWWATLSDEHRVEVDRLCDRRSETCFFGVVSDESELPEVERGLCESRSAGKTGVHGSHRFAWAVIFTRAFWFLPTEAKCSVGFFVSP